MSNLAEQTQDDAQRPSKVHVVRRGDTLSHIASRYGTSVARLVSMNGLGSRHRSRRDQDDLRHQYPREILARHGDRVR